LNLEGVSRTALMTLRARADEHKKRRRLFADPDAVAWLAKLGWPKELDRHYSWWVQGKTAIRVDHIDELVRTCREGFDSNTVVELACGLSSRRQRIGNPGLWIDLDLPEVITVREGLGISGEGQRHLAASVMDFGWMDALAGRTPEKTIVIAEGLFYYLPLRDVYQLFEEMRRRLPGAAIIYDVIGEVDFESARKFSDALGAPIHWANKSPFEQGMIDFGVATIPGLEPEGVVADSVKRAPQPWRFLLQRALKIENLRDRRSGIIVGWLAPLR
jgi:O-methyltransferase involved in polyketide biosynthesis